MRDTLEARVKQLEDLLLEVQNENAKLRDMIVNPKWEYGWRLIDHTSLNTIGMDGWEIAAMNNVHIVFKRRVRE